jgi:hypothetical protein
MQNVGVQDKTKKTALYKYMTLATFHTYYSQDSHFGLCSLSEYPGCITVQKDPCGSIHFCTAEVLAFKAKTFFLSVNCFQNFSYLY